MMMEALSKITVALSNEKRTQSLVYFDYQTVNPLSFAIVHKVNNY